MITLPCLQSPFTSVSRTLRPLNRSHGGSCEIFLTPSIKLASAVQKQASAEAPHAVKKMESEMTPANKSRLIKPAEGGVECQIRRVGRSVVPIVCCDALSLYLQQVVASDLGAGEL